MGTFLRARGVRSLLFNQAVPSNLFSGLSHNNSYSHTCLCRELHFLKSSSSCGKEINLGWNQIFLCGAPQCKMNSIIIEGETKAQERPWYCRPWADVRCLPGVSSQVSNGLEQSPPTFQGARTWPLITNLILSLLFSKNSTQRSSDNVE